MVDWFGMTCSGSVCLPQAARELCMYLVLAQMRRRYSSMMSFFCFSYRVFVMLHQLSAGGSNYRPVAEV